MRYVYFPGCSLEAAGAPYQTSISAILGILNLEFEELEDWNCCGSTAYMSFNETTAFAISARNLALAQNQGNEVVAPCSACFLMLNKTNTYLRESSELKRKIDIALNEAGLKYDGRVNVRHLLDVIVHDVGYEQISAMVKVKLDRLKVAPYYGCMITRPECEFDDSEMPTFFDKLISTIGAEFVNFPMKTRCCGGTLSVTKEDLALEMIKNILLCAVQNNADCIVTCCPLCQINLDAYQKKISERFSQNLSIPIIYFTQLMGIAFGIPGKKLALNKTIVPTKSILKKVS